MSDQSIYNDELIKHNRFPSHNFDNPSAAYVHEKINPSCGDEIKLFVDIEDGVVKKGSFEGPLCAVSKGAADMMFDQIIGKDINEAKKSKDIVFRMFEGSATDDEINQIGETKTLESLRSSKARAKCVLFVWKALEEILNVVNI